MDKGAVAVALSMASSAALVRVIVLLGESGVFLGDDPLTRTRTPTPIGDRNAKDDSIISIDGSSTAASTATDTSGKLL